MIFVKLMMFTIDTNFIVNYVLRYFSFIQIFSRLGIQCIVDIITTNERATIFYAIVDVFTRQCTIVHGELKYSQSCVDLLCSTF